MSQEVNQRKDVSRPRRSERDCRTFGSVRGCWRSACECFGWAGAASHAAPGPIWQKEAAPPRSKRGVHHSPVNASWINSNQSRAVLNYQAHLFQFPYKLLSMVALLLVFIDFINNIDMHSTLIQHNLKRICVPRLELYKSIVLETHVKKQQPRSYPSKSPLPNIYLNCHQLANWQPAFINICYYLQHKELFLEMLTKFKVFLYLVIYNVKVWSKIIFKHLWSIFFSGAVATIYRF